MRQIKGIEHMRVQKGVAFAFVRKAVVRGDRVGLVHETWGQEYNGEGKVIEVRHEKRQAYSK